MNSDLVHKLEFEVEKGDLHKVVYEQYVLPFFQLKQKELFELFCDCSCADVNKSASILHMSKALESMKGHFLHYIETGELAKQTLNEVNK